MGKAPPPTRPIRNKWTAPYLELTNIHQIVKQLPTSVICPHWFLLKLFVFTFTFCSLLPSVWNFSCTHGTSLKFHIELVVTHSETKWNSHCLTEIFFAPHMVPTSLLAIHARGNVRNQVRKQIADCVANFSENEIVLCFFFSILVKPHLEKRPCMRGLMLSL